MDDDSTPIATSVQIENQPPQSTLRMLAAIRFGFRIGSKNNLRSALGSHAQTLIENGKAEEAVMLLMDSNSRWPDEKYAEEIPMRFGRAAIAAAKTKGWKEAFQIVERGVKQCPKDEWLPRALVMDLKEKLGEIESNQGVKAAGEWAATMRNDFPNANEILIANGEYVKQISRDLSSQKKFAQAREAIVVRAAMLTQPLVDELMGVAIYGEASALADQNQWQKATEICLAELKKQPKNELLSTNAIYFLDRWARMYMDKEEWEKAIDVYQEGLELFPSDSTLKQNLAYCQGKLK